MDNKEYARRLKERREKAQQDLLKRKSESPVTKPIQEVATAKPEINESVEDKFYFKKKKREEAEDTSSIVNTTVTSKFKFSDIVGTLVVSAVMLFVLAAVWPKITEPVTIEQPQTSDNIATNSSSIFDITGSPLLNGVFWTLGFLVALGVLFSGWFSRWS